MRSDRLQQPLARLSLLLCAVAVCGCGGTAHWDYGDDGPAVWAELSPDYALCANGSSQSPIDLALPELGEPAVARIEFSAAPGVMTFNEHVEDIVDNGHTIQVSFDDSSVIQLDGAAYELEQFHFHTPSEHTLDGIHFPMETHYVYRSAAGRFLVVGVFVTTGEHNSAFDHLVSNLPDRGGSRHVEKVVTSLEQMAPGGARGFRYSGSLTTPPCLEEVIWLISAHPLEMSEEQLESFASRMGHNARPVQPVNGRLLSEIKFVEDPAP
jgi:carbonic anhydrase